jgi:hypothetical protein
MTVGLGVVSDFEGFGVLVFAGANIIGLAFLASHATDGYLTTKARELGPKTDPVLMKNFQQVRMRLQSFWMLLTVFLTALVLKMVLPADLADQIIAAWFVGQGFALQPYVQSYISGVRARGNSDLDQHLYNQAEVAYHGRRYKVIDRGVMSITLKDVGSDKVIEAAEKPRDASMRVVSWTELESMVFL